VCWRQEGRQAGTGEGAGAGAARPPPARGVHSTCNAARFNTRAAGRHLRPHSHDTQDHCDAPKSGMGCCVANSK
jgi:hypothetical protein